MGQMALMSIFSWLIDKQQTNKREGKNLGRNGNEWRCRQVKWWTVVDRLPGRRPSISRVADVRKGAPRVCKVDRSNRDDRDSMTATRTEEETHGGNHTTLFLWSITATKMPQWKKRQIDQLLRTWWTPHSTPVRTNDSCFTMSKFHFEKWYHLSRWRVDLSLISVWLTRRWQSV